MRQRATGRNGGADDSMEAMVKDDCEAGKGSSARAAREKIDEGGVEGVRAGHGLFGLCFDVPQSPFFQMCHESIDEGREGGWV